MSRLSQGVLKLMRHMIMMVTGPTAPRDYSDMTAASVMSK